MTHFFVSIADEELNAEKKIVAMERLTHMNN